jgi:hypothetical protein
MHTAFKIFAYAAVLACVSVTGSLQLNAADDTGAHAGSQVVAGNAGSDVPSMTDSADTAFKKLDRAAKGYVTYDDVASLPDFATAFANADSSHLGRLNLTAFTQVWTAYAKGRN